MQTLYTQIVCVQTLCIVIVIVIVIVIDQLSCHPLVVPATTTEWVVPTLTQCRGSLSCSSIATSKLKPYGWHCIKQSSNKCSKPLAQHYVLETYRYAIQTHRTHCRRITMLSCCGSGRALPKRQQGPQANDARVPWENVLPYSPPPSCNLPPCAIPLTP